MKLFVTGIDTDVGKSVAVGLLARCLATKGHSVITQKIVQTGCVGISEDVLTHRRLMGIDVTDSDLSGLSCPYVLPFPASPHLSAASYGIEIDPERIFDCAQQLALRYDDLIIEGVGGLYVPLVENYTVLDYIQEHAYPVLLVASPKLGSINHTLMSLEVMRQHGINLRGILYNKFNCASDTIATDSRTVFVKYLKRWGFPEIIMDIPAIAEDGVPDLDFGELLQ